MDLVLFDVGDTLIDDPFEEVLDVLYSECLERHKYWSLGRGNLAEFFKYWRDENIKTDFPFASHFLQEETWLARALLRLNRKRKVPPVRDVAVLCPTILKKYRELARIQISAQPQLDVLREIFRWLRRTGATVGVASNDREFATKAMLTWANLARYQDWIFTSEELSQKYPKAEKPMVEFYHAIFAEMGRRNKLTWPSITMLLDSAEVIIQS